MLKATLFTILCGLLSSHRPVIPALAGVVLLCIGEILLLAWCSGHSALHYGAGFFALYFVGQLSVIGGRLWRPAASSRV